MKKIRQLLQFLEGQRHTFVLALCCVMVNVLFAAVIPLIIRTSLDSVLGGKPLELPAWVSAAIGGEGAVAWVRDNLWSLLAILVSLTAVQGLFLFGRGKLAAMTSEGSARRMRNRLYNHLERLPYDYHVKAQTGDIIQRCTSDIETVMGFVGSQFIDAFSTVFQVVVVLFIMISMNPGYTLVTVALIPVITIATVRFFLGMMKVFSETDEAEGFMSAALQENLTGVRVVKAFAAQQLEMDKFDEKNRKYRDLVMKIVKLMSDYWSVSDFLCMVQYAAVIVVGAYWAATGTITIGTLVAFSTYAGMLIWPIRGLGQSMGFMGQSFVSLRRIFEILDAPAEDYTTGKAQVRIDGAIEFEHVRFGYDPEKPVLDDVTFSIPKGSTTAILGATGSGKSTLLHLLLRMYDYQNGSIRLDGQELSELSRQAVREKIGIVLQEPFLFSKNLRENIRIGMHDASDPQVEEAAGIACVHDAILEFEAGYDTMVGERGVTLSGGQRQRVAIARTVLRDVPILIFDDSLSAVDTETDAAIRAALKDRSRDTTTIIVSHRITTLAEADQILVLEHGKIAQRGTHEELIAQEGHYKRIWDIQSSIGEQEESA